MVRRAGILLLRKSGGVNTIWKVLSYGLGFTESEAAINLIF